MRIAIAGGHGKIALRLTRLLHERGNEVISLVRKRTHFDDVRAAGGEPVLCDLEVDAVEEVAEAVHAAEAVVFAAGAGPGSGPERKWSVDCGGAVKLIAAAQANRIDRYVMVSSIGADAAREGEDTFSVYLRAKGKADAELQASGLAYTIVRPAYLDDEPGNGRVRIAEHVGDDASISRDDVAAVLAVIVNEHGTARTVFEVASGDAPVEEAVASLVATRASQR
jgi:uncharacterized protein YbjT (DUF2867 family)